MGIISFGEFCMRKVYTPGVFSDVRYYTNFIIKTIKSNGGGGGIPSGGFGQVDPWKPPRSPKYVLRPWQLREILKRRERHRNFLKILLIGLTGKQKKNKNRRRKRRRKRGKLTRLGRTRRRIIISLEGRKRRNKEVEQEEMYDEDDDIDYEEEELEREEARNGEPAIVATYEDNSEEYEEIKGRTEEEEEEEKDSRPSSSRRREKSGRRPQRSRRKRKRKGRRKGQGKRKNNLDGERIPVEGSKEEYEDEEKGEDYSEGPQRDFILPVYDENYKD